MKKISRLLFSIPGKYIKDDGTFQVDGEKYFIKDIGRIIYQQAPTPEIQILLLYIVIFIIGIYLLTVLWIVGLIIIGIAGFNLFQMFHKLKHPKYLVQIIMRNDKHIRIEFSEKNNAHDFCQILKDQRK
jgi:hypothetical protein